VKEMPVESHIKLLHNKKQGLKLFRKMGKCKILLNIKKDLGNDGQMQVQTIGLHKQCTHIIGKERHNVFNSYMKVEKGDEYLYTCIF
jgi:hypothetical protein